MPPTSDITSFRSTTRSAQLQHPIHPLPHVLEEVAPSRADLGSRPAVVADFTQGLDHIRPILVALADIDPRILAFLEFRNAKALEVELDHAFAELANPITRLHSVFHHVAAIEV